MRNRLITGAAAAVAAVSLALGLSAPTASHATPAGANTGPWGVALGDLNRDGQKDIVVATGGGNTIRALISNGSALDAFTPVRVLAVNDVANVATGGNHTCASFTNKSVRCWGLGTSGQLATANDAGDADMATHDSPTIAAGVTDAWRLALGAAHSCSITLAGTIPLDGGTIKCWGSNKYGQLGDGTTTTSGKPVTVPGINDAIDVSLGARHSCAVRSDHTAVCWGDNAFGQLGTGDRTNSTSPTAVVGLEGVTRIGAGATHTCALIDDGTVKCWGNGAGGRIGDGTGSRAPVTRPRTVTGITDAKTLSVGSAHACVILNDGSIKCWGVGANGQIGDGATENRVAPVSVLKADKAALTGARLIAAGGSHTCTQVAAGNVYCWGSNANGQIGDGKPALKTRPVPVEVPKLKDTNGLAAGAATTCAIGTVSGTKTALCSGGNLYGQLGNGFGFVPRPPLAAGSSPASLAITDMNADGNLDVVAPNAGHDRVQRFFGDGQGGLSKQTEVEIDGNFPNSLAGPTPTDVAITDLNRDGFPDIAAANLGTRNISLLLNQGDGEVMQENPNPSTGRLPNGLIASDLNGDRLVDFASATYGNGSMMVQIQQPLTKKDKAAGKTFKFGAYFQFKIGEGPVGIVSGDFDGDGINDLATGSQYLGAFEVILSRPNKKTKKWSFKRLTLPANGIVPQGIAAGDVTGDRKPDIVLADTARDRVAVLPTLGRNKYAKPIFVKLPANSSPVSLAVGDVSGDGRNDIVVVLGEEERVGVLLQLGGGRFKFSQSESLVNRNALVVTEPSIVSGLPELPLTGAPENPLVGSPGEWDINNDGFPDLLPQIADPNDDTALIDPYLYQWKRSSNKTRWVDIADATTSSYTPTSDDLNRSLQLCVTAVFGSVNSAQACTEPTEYVTDPNVDTGGAGLKNRNWKKR